MGESLSDSMNATRISDHVSNALKVSPEVIKVLNADIEDIYMDNREPEHVKNDKQDIVQIFNKYIKGDEFRKKMAKSNLQVLEISTFGSSATPLASYSGDLDLCIWLKPMLNGIQAKLDHNAPLRVLLNGLRNNCLGLKGTKEAHYVKFAKVPIIKIYIYNYEVDISAHIGELQHPNTCSNRVIEAYNLFNPKFVPLCFFVKEWLKYIVENDPKGKDMAEVVIPNSYAMTLLVAQFMVAKKVLPNLFKNDDHKLQNAFKLTTETTLPDIQKLITDEIVKSFRDKNREAFSADVGMLFYDFLNYLTIDVNLKDRALKVESAEFAPLDSVEEFPKEHELIIIDVFDKLNPGRRVRKLDGFLNILKEAKRRIEEARNPARVTDRLYDLTIDYKLLERGARLKFEKVSKSLEGKVLKDHSKSVNEDGEVIKKKEGKNHREQFQDPTLADKNQHEEAHHQAKTNQPYRKYTKKIGGQFGANRPGSSGSGGSHKTKNSQNRRNSKH